jgi:hypothetical protein
MKIFSLLLALFLLHLQGASALCQSPPTCERNLDLSHADTSARPGHSIGFGPVGSGTDLAHAPVFPLTVTLLSTDKQTYSINDSFIFEVELANDSNEACLVPVSPRPIYRDGDTFPENYRHVMFEFVIGNGGPSVSVIDTFVLYGSTGVPGSLVVLQPNECMTLKLPGYFQIYNNDQRRGMILRSTTQVQTGVYAYLFDPRDAVYSRYTRPYESPTIPITVRGTVATLVERTYDRSAPHLTY